MLLGSCLPGSTLGHLGLCVFRPWMLCLRCPAFYCQRMRLIACQPGNAGIMVASLLELGVVDACTAHMFL